MKAAMITATTMAWSRGCGDDGHVYTAIATAESYQRYTTLHYFVFYKKEKVEKLDYLKVM